jgi:hypothetical protein
MRLIALSILTMLLIGTLAVLADGPEPGVRSSTNVFNATNSGNQGNPAGPAAPPLIEDQSFSQKLCALRELRDLQIVASDPDGDDLTFSKISGPGSIDPVTGVLTYTPDTSGVYSFVISVSDETASDTANFTDSVWLNQPAYVQRYDSIFYLCTPETICFPVVGEDPDDDKIDILMLEGPGEFTQLDDSSGETCFDPADVDSATYMFVYRGLDSCTSNSGEEPSGRNRPGHVTQEASFCCLDTLWMTVIIDQPPVITCPDEIFIDNCDSAEHCFSVSVEDPEGGPVEIRVISGNATVTDHGICFAITGSDEFEIVIEATDSCGHADTCYLPVEINCGESIHFDIKPTSCPNPLNMRGNWDKGRSVIPAAILGTEELDVRDVDPTTVRLEGVPAERWAYEDVTRPVEDRQDSCDCTEEGADGYEDLTLKFLKKAVIEALGDRVNQDYVLIKITGQFYDGGSFEGYDCMIIRNGAARVTVDESDDLPASFALLGNYPNPFNPTTKISCYLPEPTDVTIEIFNLLGRRVRTLVSEHRSTGFHEVEWDATDDNGAPVASGIYLYRLSAGSIADTKKMLLLK